MNKNINVYDSFLSSHCIKANGIKGLIILTTVKLLAASIILHGSVRKRAVLKYFAMLSDDTAVPSARMIFLE